MRRRRCRARALLARADRGLPRADRRARRDAQLRRRSRSRSTRGCGSTRRMRSTAADARGRAARAAGDAPFLCGVPIGLKDLYAVAGKPLTASSRVLDVVPERDCDAWARADGRGDGAARPPAHARVRLRRNDRPGRESLGARALRRRLERRLRRRARVAPGACGDRHRHRRLAAHPLARVRHVDDQADARPALDPRHRPARRRPSTTRADGPGGAGLRAAARGDGRRARRPRSAGRSGAGRSRRGSPISIPTSPTASSARSPRSGRARRAAAPAGPPRRGSASSSTSCSPRCSSGTAASTTGATTTATRTAPGSSTLSSGR